MATTWTYSHPALQLAPLRSSAEVIASAPASAQWAAALAGQMRASFAQHAQALPGRVSQIAFTATLDTSGNLTVTMTTSP